MDYFILTCGDLIAPPRSSELANLVPTKMLNKEQARQLATMNVFLLRPKDNSPYGDLITSPIYLISDEMKELFAKYDRTLVFRAVRLVNENSKKQSTYWIMGMEEIYCLAEEAVLGPQPKRHLVLDEERIGRTPIFKLGGVPGKYLVVRLDVAESLLRRPFYGIELKKISVKEKGGVS